MREKPVKLYGHTVPYAGHPAARLFAGLFAYGICIFMMNRYGYAVLARLVRMTGIKLKTPYAAAFLQLLGVFVVMLAVCALIRQIHVFYGMRRSCLYGIFLGGYMFLYSAAGIAFELCNAEGLQSWNTIIFSVLYFTLIGVTEELVFRGITADLLMQIFMRTEPKTKESTSQNTSLAYEAGFNPTPAVIISGLIFALSHAMNIRSAEITGVVVQMAGAFVMGMFLTAIYYRTRNIYAVMILHIVNDLAAALPFAILKGGEGAGISDVISGYGAAELVMLIPYVVLVMALLRPGRRREILEMWKGENSDSVSAG